MTVLVVIVMSLAVGCLAGCVALLVSLQRRLTALEASVAVVAERPAGLSVDDAESVADLAARRAAAAVQRSPLLPSLPDRDDDTTPRLSGPRIKAAGWAAGASETVRRLRQGA